ncbi:nitrogen regulatory protein P-II [Prolixibacter bellariivorans]|uniref:Nitrogen regulatory protein P-II n=1 Tax=Prolixibacter bellariivorans TaxID=314319 RepID=A0A5M4AWU6_9BACT|nr:P-II family nitrogen regulator [Prolixibacter bellariivorans]GET32083.1 nitrogen regulatory protein P-II [Prolixibacter bellariivorans]
MKKIEAIIRKTKFDEVKEALKEVGIDFFSYWDVRGIGQARQERVYRGVVYDTSSIERTKLSIIVRDKNVNKTVKAILDTAQTGEIGDGKIFVVDIQESYRIRTGESGDEALFIKGLEE